RRYVRSLSRRRRLLQVCDVVTVSTVPLARATEILGRPACVVPNSLNREQLRIAAAITPIQRSDGVVRIGYFSGSRTHQRDFACCEAALLAAMAQHAGLRFRVVGYLDLGPDWDRFGDRVERIDWLEPDALLRSLAETDINLAPL